MTTYAEIVQALRDAGYLNDTDLDAAAAVLVDALVIQEAEKQEAILDASSVVARDEELIKEAEALITAACANAATALAAAGLIDETNAVAVMIANLWLNDDEE